MLLDQCMWAASKELSLQTRNDSAINAETIALTYSIGSIDQFHLGSLPSIDYTTETRKL